MDFDAILVLLQIVGVLGGIFLFVKHGLNLSNKDTAISIGAILLMIFCGLAYNAVEEDDL